MALRYRTTARIAAPADTVWDVLTDVERMPEWTPSMTRVRLVDEDRLELGTAVEVRQPRMPRMTWIVDELTPGRHFRWSAVSGGTVTHGEHWLAPRPDGRQVDVTLEIRHAGPRARLVGALTMRRTARYVEMEMQGLKAASEAAAAGLER
ncbi:SRPBCC family protein [Georgenia faecalis]|uniref:SRPBCC family protein n=1 Tax=Georgenia faecalis TaxID=2483799 RepID=UPI0019D30B0C|nr:SRPBCC family protein [Georgenia faecalis]